MNHGGTIQEMARILIIRTQKGSKKANIEERVKKKRKKITYRNLKAEKTFPNTDDDENRTEYKGKGRKSGRG